MELEDLYDSKFNKLDKNSVCSKMKHTAAGKKRELKEELNLENLNIKHLDTIIYPYKNYIFNNDFYNKLNNFLEE